MLDKKQLDAFAEALESMQRQDKDLYKQLLMLQQSIQVLKVELKKERDECEEAFRDLQAMTSQSTKCTELPTAMNKQNARAKKPTEQQESLEDKKAINNESNIETKSFKHDRQDSGISVKNCDIEPSVPELQTTENAGLTNRSARVLTSVSNLSTQVPSPVFSPSTPVSAAVTNPVPTPFTPVSTEVTHSVPTSDSKRELTPVSTSKPVPVPKSTPIICHSKQDSGIILDDETESDTKLLSRLVQSSRAFLKSDNRKIQSVQNRLRQVVQNGMLNQKRHNRARSTSDLNKSSPLKPFRDPNSLPIPNHSHSNSCPITSIKRSNQESVVPSLHVRPTQRSASVVDLDKLDKKSWNTAENGRRGDLKTKAQSQPNITRVAGAGDKPQTLRAVFVSACEVQNVASGRRAGGVLSRHSSLDGGRMPGNGGMVRELLKSPSGPQRRLTVLGLRPERGFHAENKHMMVPFNLAAVDAVGRDAGFLSPSFQYPRNRARHHTMSENNDLMRRRSLNVCHKSSKSWDGNMERHREFSNLLRSSSQVSLV